MAELSHDLAERFFVSYGAVRPPAAGLVEPASVRVVRMHPEERLAEAGCLQLLQRTPHQRLTDSFAPALRRRGR